MAVKVTKGQLSDGTISKNACHEEYYLCGQFHGFMKKCTILPILGLRRYTISISVGIDHLLFYSTFKAILSFQYLCTYFFLST